jgi:hypothetical protein
MFQPFGKTGRQVFPVDFNDAKHEVVVTLSYAKDDARILAGGTDAGSEPHGKHARNNVGVSIVRADRELVLDSTWTNNDLRERWWGAEISFPPALDEVFGVTNNKQSATRFTEMANYYLDDRNDDEWQEIQAIWTETDDPQRHLIAICNYLKQQLNKMRSSLRDQTKGRAKSKQRHEEKVESKATKAFNDRAHAGESAGVADLNVDPDAKRASIETDLVKKRYSALTAKDLAEYVVHKDLKVMFVEQELPESDSFFHIEVLPGVTEVVFNTSHPAFSMLIRTLDQSVEDSTAEQLQDRIRDASDTLRLLLAAWARYEAEEKAGDRQDAVRRLRQDWGRMARSFLRDFDTSSETDS